MIPEHYQDHETPRYTRETVQEQQIDDREPGQNSTLAIKFLVSIFAVITFSFILGLFFRSTLRFSPTYNEGWNAGLMGLWVSGEPLYHPPSAWIVNNYPPLSFVLVRVVMTLVPDAVFAGRLVSAAAFVAASSFIALILQALSRDAVASILGGLVFAAFMAINGQFYVATDDPQMLSIAISLAGLFIYTLRPNNSLYQILSSSVFVLSLFVKHNNIAMPLTLALWLLIFDRRAFLRFSATGLLLSAGLFYLFAGLFGPNFTSGLLAPRHYALARAFRWTMPNLTPILPLMVFAVMPAFLLKPGRFAILFALYVGMAAAIGALELGGDGTGINALFEIVIAASLGSGLLVARLADTQREFGKLRIWAIAGIIACTLLTPGLVDRKDILTGLPWFVEMHNRERRTLDIVNIIQRSNGPALCATNIFCYWAGKPFAFDAFNFDQSVRAGRIAPEALAESIASGKYSVIELEENGEAQIQRPGAMFDIGSLNSQEIKRTLDKIYQKIPFTGTNIVLYVRTH